MTTRALLSIALLALLSASLRAVPAPSVASHPYPAHGLSLAPETPPAPDGWRRKVVRWHEKPWTDPRTDAYKIAACESNHNSTAENPVSSASGRWQFLAGTWEWVTGLEPPASAYPTEVQYEAFIKLWDNRRGASHWQCKLPQGV